MGRKKEIIIITLVILSLLIACLSLWTNMSKEPVKGDTGEKGQKGERGLSGHDGKDGMNGSSGKNGINGTNGLNGRNGLNGTNGINGFDGVSGHDGKDCSPNKISDVKMLSVGGIYNKISCKCYNYVFWLNISIYDPENDNLHISFYYKQNINDKWLSNVIMFGNSGNYNNSVVLYDKNIYWLVEVWDGSDIGLFYYNFSFM